MHLEPFAHFELRFFDQLKKKGYGPKVIYDIGAATCGWSQAVSRIYPRIDYQLFEPLAGRFPKYETQARPALAANRNFTLHPIALGNVTGPVPMFVAPDGYSSSLLETTMPGLVRLDVPGWRLDEYARAKNLPAPNIIKIDVQGSERLILEGAGDLVAQADILFLETWLERGYGEQTVLLPELVDTLRPLGFVLVDLGGPYFGNLGQLICVDAFFLSKSLLERLRNPAAAALLSA